MSYRVNGLENNNFLELSEGMKKKESSGWGDDDESNVGFGGKSQGFGSTVADTGDSAPSGFGGGGGFGAGTGQSGFGGNSGGFGSSGGGSPEESKTMFINRFNGATEDEITECIQAQCQPSRINILMDKQIGFVDFETPEELEEALNKTFEINGNRIGYKKKEPRKLIIVVCQYSPFNLT